MSLDKSLNPYSNGMMIGLLYLESVGKRYLS